MKKLIERLRDYTYEGDTWILQQEAANEIERLTAELGDLPESQREMMAEIKRLKAYAAKLPALFGKIMTFIVTFIVPGIPVPKARPRFRRIGNFVSTYTAAKTKTYEDQVRDCARLAMGSSSPLETPVAVYLYLRVPVPASYSKKRTQACLSGIEKPVKKPDLTNVGKSLEDGMNGIVYQDDSQIVKLYMTKVFSTDPGVEIMVTECLE